jgi:hypothetical protein
MENSILCDSIPLNSGICNDYGEVKVISNKLPSSLIGYTIRKISEIMRLQQVQLQHPGVRQRVPGLAYAL